MADDLHAPLGRRPVAGRRLKLQLLMLSLSALLLVGGMGGAWLWQRSSSDLPAGAVVAKIEPAAQPSLQTPAVEPHVEAKESSGPGVTVVGPTGAPVAGGVFIKVPQDPVDALKRAPDPLLVEKSRFGPLPKRGPDGLRPMDGYARPFTADPKLPANAPRVALVVVGLGTDATFTTDAAIAMPSAVTLGFPVAGENLQRRTQDAREAGHELMLQLAGSGGSVQPAGSGSHGLAADLDPKDSLDRLHWQMSRFTGYVGVVTPRDAAPFAGEAAMRPLLGDLGQRGLFALDGGSSAGSDIVLLGPALDLPVVRADVTIDGGTAPSVIDAALNRIEQKARERGVAVGLVVGVPASIGRIALFAQQLPEHGVALAPLSAIAQMQAGPSGQSARQ